MAEPVAVPSRALSLSGLEHRAAGWFGEQIAREAEEAYIREVPEVPVLTQEILRSLEGRDPMAAALLSVVPSLPPSKAAPVLASKAAKESQAAMEKVANAKVKARRRAGKEG